MISRRQGELSTAVATALGRHTAIYAASSSVGLVLQLVNLGVLTRYLSPSEFGKLGIALVASALLTVLYNLGFLQGALSWTFGAAEEAELDVERRRGATDKPRALGTGLILTTLVAAAGTAIVVALHAIAPGFLGSLDTTLVLLVAASGAAGALWRLVVNIPRFELRPLAFALLNTARPVIVLGISLPLVMAGHGVSGVLAGTAAGTALTTVIGLIVSRHSIRLQFSSEDLRGMAALGGAFVPIIAAFWVIQNVDLVILSGFASHADVGLYRTASRIGGCLSYLVSAFLMAWTPLRNTPLFAAAEGLTGESRMAALTTTYFALACFAALLVLAVGAEALVRVAGPAYEDAAPLIPLLGLAFLAYGAFIVIYRGVRMPGRRRAYPQMAVASACVFVVVALALTPAFGAYGAAVAPTIGFLTGSAGLLWLAHRTGSTAPFEWRRILTAAAVAAVCILAARVLEKPGGAWAVAAPLAAVAAYPLLLLATGVVSRQELRLMAGVARRAVAPAGMRTDLTPRLQRLSTNDRLLLRLLACDGASAAEAATATEMGPADAARRLVSLLRELADLPRGDRERDLWLGALLTSDEPADEHEARTRRLVRAGLSEAEIESLADTLQQLRFQPPEAWGRELATGAATPPLARVPSDVPGPV